MMDSIKIFYKECEKMDLEKFLREGGIVVDVRTHAEFLAGHIEGAVNLPLDSLLKNLHRIPNRHQPIITCCSTGMRSASAKSLLEALGYTRVCNGGSFKHLHDKFLEYGTASI
jgi:Rhodanese-related sulfurtransferase